MMYNEFLAGTGAPENKESYNQFKLIEKIYMDCEQMSKAEAYSIWKKTYGKELKARKKRMADRAQMLLSPVEEFEALPDQEQTRIARELNRMAHKAWYEGDGSKLMSECGFRVYESEDFGFIFGIDGAGYDFYESHWIPLYKARGLRWHDPAAEQQYQMERKGYTVGKIGMRQYWMDGDRVVEEVLKGE